MKRIVLLTSFPVLMVLVLFEGSDAADSRLVGVWTAEAYIIEGQEHPMEGIFIFTDRHFSANTFFRASGGEMEDANANAGTYRTEGDRWFSCRTSRSTFVRGIQRNRSYMGNESKKRRPAPSKRIAWL